MESTHTPKLGEQVQTTRHFRAAERLAIAFRLARELPDIMTAEETMEDNCYHYFLTFCRWMAHNLIPLNFTIVKEKDGRFKSLEPSNPNQKRILTPITLIGYIGKHLVEVRGAFPGHPGWSNKKDTEWWTDMRVSFKEAATSFQMRHIGEDYVWGESEILPLYWTVEEGSREAPWDKRTLQHIMQLYIKTATASNGHIETASIISTSSDVTARGDEVKFQSFKDWTFDVLLPITDTPWAETKTLNLYAMPRAPDDDWYKDWYWSF